MPNMEMHTENLIKPPVQPGTFWMRSKVLRYQVLSWVGIVGGAISLFTLFREIIDLSEWARVLVIYWRGWTTAFWQLGSRWHGARLPPEYAILFSFASFSLMTAIGARRAQAEPKVRTSEFYWSIFSYWMLSLFLMAF